MLRLLRCILGLHSPSLVFLCRIGESAPRGSSWLTRWDWRIAREEARKRGPLSPWWAA